MDFSGKVAVITGASSGIGAELARQLSAAGAKVGLIALPGQLLDETAKSISTSGRVVRAVGVDVSNHQAVGDVIRELGADLGPIAILILNAGVGGITAGESFSV